MPELVRVDRTEAGVHTVTLDRPNKRNALSIELRFALAEALASLGADETCHGAVLTGAGDAFCAGMDFTQFGGDEANRRRLFDSTRAAFGALLDFEKPLVAAVNGAAVGGGFVLALTCDARLMAEDAYFGFFEVRRGIPAPFELVRCFVEEAVARDWCETGRRIDASEARFFRK